MIPAALAIVGLLGIVAFLIHVQSKKETLWAKERNLLISRIQTPHLAPQLAVDDTEEIEPSPILGADGDFYSDGRRVID